MLLFTTELALYVKLLYNKIITYCLIISNPQYEVERGFQVINTNNDFKGFSGIFAKPKQYAISKKQELLIETAADWITSKVAVNLPSHEPELLLFKASIQDFLKSRFAELGCANLRSIGSQPNLYVLADKFNIPHDTLPENISIIVNDEMCYYLKGSSQHRYII